MGIRVALHHKTLYEYYDRLVTLSPQIVRLRPAPHSRTRVTHRQLLAKLLINACYRRCGALLQMDGYPTLGSYLTAST
jgi:hypothetical protein